MESKRVTVILAIHNEHEGRHKLVTFEAAGEGLHIIGSSDLGGFNCEAEDVLLVSVVPEGRQ